MRTSSSSTSTRPGAATRPSTSRTSAATSSCWGPDRAAEEAFLAEYAAATGWRDPGSYHAFSAYTWLKIAKQYAVGSGPQQPVPAGRRDEAVARALAEGARCLSG